MTAAILAVPAARVRVPLAVRELRRFLVNPLFLAGIVVVVIDLQGTPPVDLDEATYVFSIALGGFGMMAMYWQTRSLRGSAEFADVTPTSLPARTAALCWTAVVPGLLGVACLLTFVARYHFGNDAWVGMGTTERIGVLASEFVLPAIGGPLLGVALGRWVRFPGAAFVTFMIIYGWISVGYIVGSPRPDTTWANAIRLFSPFAFWFDNDSPGGVGTVRFAGSPWWYVAFQLCLCGIAVLVARLRGADGPERTRTVRGLAVTGAATVVTFVLAVAL